MSAEAWEWFGRIGLTVFSILGTLAAGAVLLIAKRIYASLGILFAKYDAQQDEITQMKLFLTHVASHAPGITAELYKLLLPVKARDRHRDGNGD